MIYSCKWNTKSTEKADNFLYEYVSMSACRSVTLAEALCCFSVCIPFPVWWERMTALGCPWTCLAFYAEVLLISHFTYKLQQQQQLPFAALTAQVWQRTSLECKSALRIFVFAKNWKYSSQASISLTRHSADIVPLFGKPVKLYLKSAAWQICLFTDLYLLIYIISAL